MVNKMEIEIKEFDSMKAYTYLGIEENHDIEHKIRKRLKKEYIRILRFRFVFWDALPCKIIVGRRFRGTCCLYLKLKNLI
jgi:hypothetical protein